MAALLPPLGMPLPVRYDCTDFWAFIIIPELLRIRGPTPWNRLQSWALIYSQTLHTWSRLG